MISVWREKTLNLEKWANDKEKLANLKLTEFARAAYPTASPVTVLPGCSLPAPTPEPTYPVPRLSLFFPGHLHSRLGRLFYIRLLWRHVIFVYYSNISSTL